MAKRTRDGSSQGLKRAYFLDTVECTVVICFFLPCMWLAQFPEIKHTKWKKQNRLGLNSLMPLQRQSRVMPLTRKIEKGLCDTCRLAPSLMNLYFLLRPHHLVEVVITSYQSTNWCLLEVLTKNMESWATSSEILIL